ncbi:hypothetical protein AVEN_158966-1 [Araneus ventricosus]|uniref:RNase H type-1 domain-containing protein n=1 Tax=Araneus ventricosus TaxID=182803 RepID=A0A4Y2BAQ9_ARAVE|nr:hypothetical protein AVEN_158966-1 [Araneus ventricosus]
MNAKEDVKIGSKFSWKDFEGKVECNSVHPAQWISIPYGTENQTTDAIEIFTDGSKLNKRFGAAMIAYYNGVEIYSEECRLSDHALSTRWRLEVCK